MATNLVQTINGKEKYIIYYDADVFNQNVTLSIHLTLPKITNTNGHIQFSNVEAVEWNTIYEENFGTNGSLDGQKVENVNVTVNPGLNQFAYQNYDFALLNSANYISNGTSGSYAGTITSSINVLSDTVDVVSTENFQDTGVLQLNGQILNYYQTVNNVPQYIEESLQDIAVQIWALPLHTVIVGEQKVPLNSYFTYSIPDTYDPGNAYLYQWRLRMINPGDTNISNSRADIENYTSVPDNTRSVLVHFKKGGYANLEVIIYGPTGCPRIIRKQICIQLPLSKMLVIRNRLV